MAPEANNTKSKEELVAHLEEQHRHIFVRAISIVLSTKVAELTYAQIIDGLPLASVADDSYENGGSLSLKHSLRAHTELCPGVLEITGQFQAGFDPNALQFDSRLTHAYQAAPPGSRVFNTRLIDMVAVAVHQIAVQLFKVDTSLHKDDGIASWVPPKDDTVFWTFFPEGPPPTLFRHEWYGDYDQYPDGVADVVGYWAESRILGGVVLFDRRDSETPSKEQQLIGFLLSTAPKSCPLPILGNENNVRRVDPEEPIEVTGIYRDRWERKPLSPDAPDMRIKDVYDDLDYPAMKDFRQAQERAYRRKAAEYH